MDVCAEHDERVPCLPCELRIVVEQCDRVIAERAAQIDKGKAMGWTDSATNVYSALDTQGRPLVGDVLAAKAQALAALAQLRR